MRLAACVPNIPAQLVSSLETCGIRTDTDLLFSASPFDILRRLPPGSTTLSELKQVTALVAKLASGSGHSAADLLSLTHTERSGEAFLSGIPQLDELLCGLATPCRLIEVSGCKGSGTTSLLLHLVLRHLVHQPKSGVLWVDSTGDFSAARAAEILELGDGARAVLDRLQISVAFEVDVVHEVLEELRLSLTLTPGIRIRGIVVDTVTALLGPNLSPVSAQGHSIMTGLMRRLRAFAQSYSITVFVVNNSTAYTPFVARSTFNNPSIRKPALGPSFAFLTDATLWLAEVRNEGPDQQEHTGDECTKHVAQVYRSKVTASNTLCSFKIRRGIIEPFDDMAKLEVQLDNVHPLS
ncbi:P-loop containing nucleoside triphosphate hydrolase protein [Mycena belliarum]|uniref:P-loop containing nucleoside triphosphate hydrolase protein n=1 Tax=Mycena belliarum TaxID=1033014 RepID=A0AAD6XRU9_9AGAR|nr:P-loop containing nucleoside triphosphate hydrolase protein [Mycena belliae]